MASVHDVAALMLERLGPMASMRVHRLAYYAQVWHLVWEGEPLFPERIEAWAAGPAIPALHQHHKGTYTLETWHLGNPDLLTDTEFDSVEVVVDTYGARDELWVSELARTETPWLKAREHVAPGERGSQVIERQALIDYYAPIACKGLVV